MTDTAQEDREQSRKNRKTLVATAVGALVGLSATLLFYKIVDSGMIPELGKSGEVAGLIAIAYFLMGLMIAIGVLSPKQGAKVLNVEDEGEIAEQKTQMLYSAVTMIFSAVTLMVLALSAPIGPIARDIALAVSVTLSAISVFCSLKMQKSQDELMREVGKECSVAAFYLLFLVGGSWSVLAHLQYVTAPAPLDWLSMFWAITLLAAFVVTGRRGLLAMR